MAKEKKALFDDSDEEEEEQEEAGLQINKAYANKYQEWRLSEELQKYRNRFGDEDLTSESSSDEEYAEPDNPEFDREFLRTMGALHRKGDPKLEGVTFFTGDYRKKKEEKEKEEKAMTVKDYERILISRGGELEEEEEGPGSAQDVEQPPESRNASSFDDGMNSDDDSGDDLLTSGLFKVKDSDKTAEEEDSEAKRPEGAMAFLRGECSSLTNEDDKGLLEGLKEAWDDPKKSTDEKWLIDFFVNERYNEDEDESQLRPYNSVVIDEETISEDEKTLDTMETFETKYRFRFQEPDEEFIKKYPRIIQDSVRAKDVRRKDKRVALKERKLREKEVKRQEIERLKALKYKEIEAKIERIKQASGNQDIDLGEKVFEEDFDEAQHEEVMGQMFDDDYYAVDDGNQKPVFQDDEELDIIQDYDQWLKKQDDSAFGTRQAGEWEEEEEEEEEQENYDAEDGQDSRREARQSLQQEMIEASTTKKGRRKSKFAIAIKRRKPVFDPKEKTFASYFDEYYQMDFEDIISGTPCRFKYRRVEPNNFGLSTEEILTAQDKELNKWVSLKKALRYHRGEHIELRDRKLYAQRAARVELKHKFLPSLFVEDPVQHHISEEEKKRLKNKKKKLRRENKLLGIADTNPDVSPEKPKQRGRSQGASNASHRRDTEPAQTGKRKKLAQISTLEAGDSVGDVTHTNEAVDEPVRKKIKKPTGASQDRPSVKAGRPQHPMDATHLKTKKSSQVKEENMMETENTVDNCEASETPASPKKINKKKKPQSTTKMTLKTNIKKKANNDSPFFQGISDSRLAAYGANPKKIKNKVKYGKHKF